MRPFQRQRSATTEDMDRENAIFVQRQLQRHEPSPIEYLEPRDLIEYCLRKMAHLTTFKSDFEKSRVELLEEVHDIRLMFDALAEVLHEQTILSSTLSQNENEGWGEDEEDELDEYIGLEDKEFYTIEELREYHEKREARAERKLWAAEKKAFKNPSPKTAFENLKMTLTMETMKSETGRLRTLEIEAGRRERVAMMREVAKGTKPEVLAAREAEKARKDLDKVKRMEKICTDAQTMIFDRPGLSYYKRKDELQTLAVALDLPNPFEGTVAELYTGISSYLEDRAEELEDDPRFAALVSGNRHKRRRTYY